MGLLFIAKCDNALLPLVKIIYSVLTYIKIAIPILLILMGTIDLGRAVLSSDDKAIKESTSRLIKRVIAAVAVFLITTVVELVMTVVSDSYDSSAKSWIGCWRAAGGKTSADIDS